MNLNTFEASPTTLTEQLLEPLNLMQENQVVTALPLAPTPPIPTPLSITPIGGSSSNLVCMPSGTLLSPKTEGHCETPSSNLKSHVKPHELLEKLSQPKVLKVSQADVDALCQVITEFKEQFSAF